jgi:hypothetical protein
MASSLAFGGARPKVGRNSITSRLTQTSNTRIAINSGALSSPRPSRPDGFKSRGEDRLQPLDAEGYSEDGDMDPVSGVWRPQTEELLFDVNLPLRPRRPQDLIRTNSLESVDEPMAAAAESCSTHALRGRVTAACQRSSFDEGQLEVCAGGGREGAASLYTGDEGGGAWSVPSITSSNISVNDLRSEAALSELDQYEPPEDDCYIYTYKVTL